MEFEQIVKRLEWLDEEHRKDKASLSSLDERLTSIKSDIKTLTNQIKDLNKKVSDIGPAAARLNQFDEILAKQK